MDARSSQYEVFAQIWVAAWCYRASSIAALLLLRLAKGALNFAIWCSPRHSTHRPGDLRTVPSQPNLTAGDLS